MAIEEVFSSKLRVKILKVLWQLGEVNVSEIVRRLGVNHKAAMAHLNFLESEGIIKHKMFGRIRLYRLNDSPKAVVVKNFLEAWDRVAVG